jgi:hypothetical protein
MMDARNLQLLSALPWPYHLAGSFAVAAFQACPATVRHLPHDNETGSQEGRPAYPEGQDRSGGSGLREVSQDMMPPPADSFTKAIITCRLYHQCDSSTLPFCTSPMYALLYVTDYIEWQGPPRRYWCFAVERYGGWLKKELNNNQSAVVALSNRMIKQEQVRKGQCHIQWVIVETLTAFYSRSITSCLDSLSRIGSGL